jgi:hypothetical protein
MSIESKIAAPSDQPQAVNVDAAPTGPQASIPDLTKRRLMRGAAAAAPVLLTLRSGALAAASCTGVKVTGLSITMNNGQGLITGYNGPINTGTNPDQCVDITLSDCPANQLDTLQAQGTTIGPVTQDNSNPPNYYCNGQGTTYSNVAIISSNAIASLANI